VVSGDQYTVNEEFQAASLRLADDLNIDELDAARLFLDAQDETDSSGRPPHTVSIIRFHQRRKFLLDCLRTIVQLTADIDQKEEVRDVLQEFVRRIVSPPGTAANYVQRCLSGMVDIKLWLQGLADKVNSASVLGQVQQSDFSEAIQFQQTSLVMQHESLGLVVFWLSKLNHSVVADFDLVLNILRRADRYDNLLCKTPPPPGVLPIALSIVPSIFDFLGFFGSQRLTHHFSALFSDAWCIHITFWWHRRRGNYGGG